MGNKKLQVWLPLIFSVVLIIGMLLGYKMGNKHGGQFFGSNSRGTLQKALDLIRLRYVDSVMTDSLQGKAIEEMINELDPHSLYLPPVQLQEANEDLEGKFDGIGIEFSVFADTINIVHVISGGPGEKAGLQIGDKIIKVNDSLLAGKNRSRDEIKNFIKGSKGSKVILQLLRDGKEQLVTVTRNTIPVSAIDAAYMMDKTTGYIKLEKFSENSYEEFMSALETLQKQGLKDLVFDLRENGGGFMDEAVDIADEFLDGDKLIVYTEGVNNKKREYRCKRPGLFEKGKLVVLVDELSASASEVVAGALQEWCRATIIGRRSFGKGLVQEQFPLGDGSAIRLTIARYYTPLGRSIQRSYEKGRKVYMDELWERHSTGELRFKDSNKVNNGKVFLTVCKDTVYGGGGIMPDIFVSIDTILYGKQLNNLIAGSNLGSFAYYYYLKNKKQMEQYKSATDFTRRFNAADLWNDFIKQPGNSIEAGLIKGREKELIQQRLKAILARYKWRGAGYYEVLNSDDVVIQKALEKIKQ
ncbi:MAG: S41 family peptidase [Chitinophagaceae bacterium]|nr:S41 family peptidase [Chitinophagaceae bacterium]